MSLPRVAVIPERYGEVLSPCGSIRMHAPFDALRRAGRADVRFLLPAEVEAFAPQVVAWHRVALRDVATTAAVVDAARRVGSRIVFDLDDHLLGMDAHPEREAYAPMVAAVRAALNAADGVWCSTEHLATLVAPSTRGRVTVMPNALDPQIWELESRPLPCLSPRGAPLRILYMGTRTHDEDYAFLAGVMAQLEARSPGAYQLHRIGVRAQDGDAAPWLHVHPIAGHVGASYPAFVHWLVRQPAFDIGVAPLMDTAFNAGKSPIKVLDYAALGIAAMASRVPAYAALEDSEACLLVENTELAWIEALELLSEDRARLPVLRDAARRLVVPAVFERECARRLEEIARLIG